MTPSKAAERAEAARLLAAFTAAGAHPVETDILQPADTLLDLYGEDIRARAFTTTDPLHGEMMLRPDFTVPVVQMHMADAADPARYAYAGEVFRRQEDGSDRSPEPVQVGFEVFGGPDPAAADAEVFALFHDLLRPLNLRIATGDIGILTAAVRGLPTSDARRAALLRHIWRPTRFRALLDRFSGKSPVSDARTALLAGADPMADAGPEIGLRSQAEIARRVEALRDDAAQPLLDRDLVRQLDMLLGLRDTAPSALSKLGKIAVDLPWIAGAVSTLGSRLTALEALGVDPESLPFEASHGRSNMEYYDGFVFSFSVPDRTDLPPVATGGRYDALTRVLGAGRSVPAVGGIIRPALTLLAGPGLC